MNAWKKGLMLLFLTSVLAACGSGEDAAEVFEQAQQASDSLESVAMDMEMSQQVEAEGTGGEGENIEMAITSSGKMQLEPLIVHQTMNVESSMGETMGLPQQDMEQYVTEDAMYMTNPMSGEWMKAPQAMQEQLNQGLSLENQSPVNQLDMFQEHISDFSMEESGDTYTFNVSATGEEMEALMRDVMEDAGGGMMNEEMLEQISINDTDITFVLEKETYYPKEVDMTMDLSMEEQGQTVHLTQDTHMTYSDYNNIEELNVPEEVVNNAEEMEIPDLQ